MTEILADILRVSTLVALSYFIVFLRVGAAVALMPALGERSVPTRVKLGLAIALTMITAPVVFDEMNLTANPPIERYILTETVIGIAIGMALRLFVLALQTAGAIAANATSLSQILGGAAADPLPAMSYILVIAALALAMMAGLHVRAIELLVLSYDALPAGTFPSGRDLSGWGLRRVAIAFSDAFVLAAPFVIFSLFYNLTLGVINKAMPQLMVAFVGAPVITAGGLVFLFLISPTILTIWVSNLNGFMSNPFGGTQ